MKKKYLYFTILLFTARISSNPHLLTFSSHKENGRLSSSFLQSLIATFGANYFVETGTYSGETTAVAAQLFKHVYTIELHQEMYNKAKTRFEYTPNISVYQGSSPTIFKRILPEIKGKILFWLDAHYCGEGSSQDNDVAGGDSITAIRRELDAIKECHIKDCTILIDDIRGFGTKTKEKEFVGCWAYPTLQDVCSQLLQINASFSFALIGDILLAYDKTKYQPNFSQVVKACTLSRLSDGHHITDKNLLEAEHIVAHASGEEKKLIHTLYQMMTNYKDPEFHHDLWYGLICMANNQFESAYQNFKKVLDRGYDHWRVFWYVAQAASKSNKTNESIEALQKVYKLNPSFNSSQIS